MDDPTLTIKISAAMLPRRTPSDNTFYHMASMVRSPEDNSVNFSGTTLVRQISDSTQWTPDERIFSFGRDTTTKTGDYPKSRSRNRDCSVKAEEATRIWTTNGYK